MNILIWAIAAAAVFGFGFWAGDEWRSGAVAQDELEAKAANDRATARVARQGDKAAERHEVIKEVLRTEFVPITQEIERVVTKIEYRDRACLDDDGLRIARDAIAAANRAAGFPAPAVSAPAGSP